MRRLFLIATLPFLLSACASTPDPAEICTTEWIKPRAEKAMSELMDDTGSAVKSMRKVADKYMQGKTPGPLQMFSLSNSLKSLEKELTRGRGIKDLKTLAKTCDDPQIITDGMTEFVSSLGLPERLSAFIKALPRYQELLESQLEDLDKP